MAQIVNRLEDRPASMARMVVDRVAASPDAEAYSFPAGGSWAQLTWAQVGERVRAIAAGLLSLGLQVEDRVAVAATTRIEWILADFGIMCAGGATTTVYPSTPDSDVAFILADSGARFAFAEDDGQIAKLRKHRDELPALEKVITFDGEGDADWVIGLAELEEAGRRHLAENPSAVDDAVAAIGPDHLATLIYTSGTTGQPKGVRLAHDCWTYEGVAINALQLLTPDDVHYLWLPLSHSFGKVLLSAQLAIGMPTAVDGDVGRIIDNLAVVRPTVVAGAPRIFEKVQARVVTMAAAEGGMRKRIFDWAVDIGNQASKRRQAGREPSGLLALKYRIADRLVFHRLQERFGGRLKYFVSGSAALSRDVQEFFHGAGILVLEGYGLTETSASICVNLPDRYRFGTVGPAIPGTELKIDADGEILVRGPSVMRGYHNLPTETEEAFTDDGWLRTGDIGDLSPDGFLKITDRKKDLIKTSGGKYVAPQPIEVLFKALCPYASQLVVHGDGRNYCVALVTLDEEELTGWAQHAGLAGAPYSELVGMSEVVTMVQGYVDEMNGRLARWETIKKFTILPRDLTIEDGELTPSLKVKRKVVERHYRDLLDAMYAG